MNKYNRSDIEIVKQFYLGHSISKFLLGNQHASEIARMSIAFIKKIRNLREETSKFPNIYPQIGIHSGNAVGGVIGSKMPRFCLFGETINLASRMESTGEPGRIQISTNTKTLLELTESEGYTIKSRGTISVKVRPPLDQYRPQTTLVVPYIKVVNFNFVNLIFKLLNQITITVLSY